mgnify:FL=1
MSTRATKESPYKVGQQIHINHLQGEDNRYDGKEGVIEDIDAIGQLHGTWGGLAVIPEADDFRVIG